MIKSCGLTQLKEKEDLTYTSSLNVFYFKNEILYFTPLNGDFQPDNMIVDFLQNNFISNDFSGLKNKSKQGIYFSYNNISELMIVEVCEVKRNKYFLIFRDEISLKN